MTWLCVFAYLAIGCGVALDILRAQRNGGEEVGAFLVFTALWPLVIVYALIRRGLLRALRGKS